jgi:hypothetical protein
MVLERSGNTIFVLIFLLVLFGVNFRFQRTQCRKHERTSQHNLGVNFRFQRTQCRQSERTSQHDCRTLGKSI